MQSDLLGNVPEIVIDVHEMSGKKKNATKYLVEILDKEKISYVIEKVPIGDILGPNDIVIERKTVNDLVNTLRGSKAGVPRLTKQIEGLLEYKRPYILIENILAIRRDPLNGCIYIPFKSRQTKGKPYMVTMETVSRIHPSSLDALIERIKEQEIKIIEGYNALHSAGLVFNILFPQRSAKTRAKKALPVIRTRKTHSTTAAEQEFFIAGIPGINVVRARNLLERFGSPIEVINRTEDWTEVPGIGNKIVRTAQQMLYTKYNLTIQENEKKEQ